MSVKKDRKERKKEADLTQRHEDTKPEDEEG
jgi:hypothetical protein